ncbi:MAG: ABC transporter ATP-binding protein [Filifactoraceae bacterium]
MRLEIRNLSKKYEEIGILNSISFSVNQGEIVSVFGVSGSGKSTLLKIIAGIESFDSGDIFLDGDNISNFRPQKRNIGLILQKPTLFPHLTISENISFPMDIRKKTKEYKTKKINELINLLRLKGLEGKYPNQISGGEQQRVAFGRALAAEPKILLMDEAFSGLDYDLRNEMCKVVKDIRESLGVTILFVTHDIDECLKLSDKVVILDKGKVLQFGDVDRVYYKPKTKDVAKLMGISNYIEGSITDGCFNTDIGNFLVSGYDDGRYTLIIRPDQLILDEKNGISAEIKKVERIGKSYLLGCSIGNSFIQVETCMETPLKVGMECKIRSVFSTPCIIKEED